ncbi:hypothetical protein [Natrinema soli]|uniref:Uncharacterized protein n=1 Tax=Natrinema soli TaxID=1930624 RepID=A0ABD5SL50_9EURY|nr:hypothetical protein [Natrinema soli]
MLPEDDGKCKTQYWSDDDREHLINYATKRVDMALEGMIWVNRETAFCDRATVVMLDGTGAREAELFSDPKDEKRDGLRWSDVDFEERSIEVYGKSRDYETAPSPRALMMSSSAGADSLIHQSTSGLFSRPATISRIDR